MFYVIILFNPDSITINQVLLLILSMSHMRNCGFKSLGNLSKVSLIVCD